MSRQGNVTIKDVAKRAKVSVASASRAINGVGRISQETKDRILKAFVEKPALAVMSRAALVALRQSLAGL